MRTRQAGIEPPYHQQLLAQCARPLSQHIIGAHWNNGAQRENERMHVFHVQVVRGHRIGNRVRGQHLRFGRCEFDHVLRIKL